MKKIKLIDVKELVQKETSICLSCIHFKEKPTHINDSVVSLSMTKRCTNKSCPKVEEVIQNTVDEIFLCDDFHQYLSCQKNPKIQKYVIWYFGNMLKSRFQRDIFTQEDIAIGISYFNFENVIEQIKKYELAICE